MRENYNRVGSGSEQISGRTLARVTPELNSGVLAGSFTLDKFCLFIRVEREIEIEFGKNL